MPATPATPCRIPPRARAYTRVIRKGVPGVAGRQALPELRRRRARGVDVIWRRRSRRRDRWHWPPAPCADCAVELLPDTLLGVRDWQRLMVTDDVWAAAGMDPLGGWLCIPCLEGRLGRPLVGANLEAVPLNDSDLDDTPRLAELKRAAAEHHARST